MIGDLELVFSSAQAITASAASTNIIDLGPLGGAPSANTIRDIGAGEPGLWLVITVVTAFTDAGSDSTVTPALQTDDSDAFGSATTLRTFDTLAALTAAGTQKIYRLEPAAYERYLRLNYTVANGNLTTGAITAEITRDVRAYRAYRGGSVSNAE